MSFANVIKQNQNNGITYSTANKECVATKTVEPTISESKMQTKQTNNSDTMISDMGNEIKELHAKDNWITVNRKRNKYPNKEVKKGGNSDIVEIQGSERTKYLHVWRLQKETTEENLEKYVRNIYKKDIDIKVQRIKHKTERDYASFTIGVPESKYEELCKPENWPINIEYCEWVWFRRPKSEPRKT